MTPRINLNNDLSQVLEALNSQAGGQADAGPRAAEMARRIEEKLILARKWSEQLKAQLASRPTLRDAVSLLTGATSRPHLGTSRHISAHLGTSRHISAHLGTSRHISPGRDHPWTLGSFRLFSAAEAETTGVSVAEFDTLRSVVTRGKAWQERARMTQARTTRGAAARPTLSEMRSLLMEGEELPLLLQECGIIAMQASAFLIWQPSSYAQLIPPS